MGSKGKAGLSESFIIGVVALVFLIVGYQTAMFIHSAAVTKIAANRDEPDTVYVFSGPAGIGNADAVPEETVTVRKNASHSPRVENVRKNLTYRKTENFRFDPNTVSVDDL